MKKSLLISCIVLPLSLQAMENNKFPMPEQNLPAQILSKIDSMNEEELAQLSSSIRLSFQELEKQDLIYLPFTPDQAQILDYHFTQKKPPQFSGFSWTSPIKGQDHSFDFSLGDLIILYRDLQSIVGPKEDLTHSSTAFSTCENYTSYFKKMIPYALCISFPSHNDHFTPDLENLNKNPEKRAKINHHFKKAQKSINSLSTITPWNWLEMRYHLKKLCNHMGFQLDEAPNLSNPTDLEGYFDLLSSDIEENKKLIEDIKEISVFLQEKISLPLETKEREALFYSARDKSYTSKLIPPIMETSRYRHFLKVFFNQSKQMNLLKNNQKHYNKILRVMEFWRLYLDLTNDYTLEEKTKLDANKITTLCNLLFPGTYEEEEIVNVINNPDTRECLERMFSSFKNPFAPHVHEILHFQYYKDKIAHTLDNLEISLETIKDVPPPSASYFSFMPGWSSNILSFKK